MEMQTPIPYWLGLTLTELQEWVADSLAERKRTSPGKRRR